MRTYAYLRTNCIITDRITSYHKDLIVKGYSVLMSRIIIEAVEANKSIFYRDKFMGLINFGLEQGDLLIVKGIDCLGKDYIEILDTIQFITEKKVRLICLDYSFEELDGEMKFNLLHVLKLCKDFESMKIKKNESIPTINLNRKAGRPKKLNDIQITEINEKIKKWYECLSIG